MSEIHQYIKYMNHNIRLRNKKERKKYFLIISEYLINKVPGARLSFRYTGRFIMFVITNIYNKKTKGPTLTELFTATRTLKKFFF